MNERGEGAGARPAACGGCRRLIAPIKDGADTDNVCVWNTRGCGWGCAGFLGARRPRSCAGAQVGPGRCLAVHTGVGCVCGARSLCSFSAPWALAFPLVRSHRGSGAVFVWEEPRACVHRLPQAAGADNCGCYCEPINPPNPFTSCSQGITN